MKSQNLKKKKINNHSSENRKKTRLIKTPAIIKPISDRQAEGALLASEENTKRLAQENATMAEIGRIISSTLNIEEVYERFAEEVHDLIPFEGIAINIINYKEGTVTVPYVSGIAVPGCQPGDIFPLEGSVTGEVVRTHSSVIIQTVDRKELQTRFPTLLTAFDTGLRSVLAVPLISKDQVIGAIHFRSTEPNSYSDQNLKLAESVGNQIAGAIANAQLFIEQKQTGEVLKESEKRYKSLYSIMRLLCDNVPDLIWVKDLEKRFIFTNKAICQKLLNAKDTDEPIGKTDMFFADRERKSHPDYPKWHDFGEICRDSDEVVLKSRKPERFDEFGNVKGEFLFLDVYKAPLWDEQGNIIGTIGCGRDITEEKRLEEERKRAEEMLSQSEERFKQVAESAGDWIWEIDANGLYTYASQVVEKILGFKIEEIVGKKYFYDFFTPDVREELKKAAFEVFAKKEPFRNFINPNLHKNGNLVILKTSGSPIVDNNGTLLGYRGADTDITEQKQAEETFKESQEKFRFLAEKMADIVWTMDLNFRTTYVSSSIEKVLGFTPEERERQSLEQMVTPESLYRIQSMFLEELQREESGAADLDRSMIIEVEYYRRDGSTVWMENTIKAMWDATGTLVGVYGVSRDITDRKRAEEELRRKDAILEAVSFASKQFLRKTDWMQSIQEALERLGKATEVSRSYIFENHTDQEGHLLTSQRNEWAAPGIVSHIDNLQLQSFSFKENGFERWVEMLSKGQFIQGHIKDLPESEREVLAFQDIQSILIVPIFVGREWWGFIGFDECDTGREWTKGEIEGLNSAAETLGAAIQQKKAEETLRQSEERYRTILENIEDGYYEVDLPGNFTFFNDSLCRMLGYSRDEMIGMGNRQYTDEENSKKLYETFNEVYRTGKPTKGFAWEVFRKDGAKVFGEVSVSLIKDSNGQPIGFRGIARDVTEHKHAEEALTQSEERYRTLVEEGFDGIWIQKGLKIIFANRRLYEMLGYEQGELEGRDHWIVYHPDYQNLTRERAKARMRGESVPSTYEIKFLRKDGSSFWGEIHAKVLRYLGEPGIQVWARDISGRKEAEETLRAEREKFRSLSENSPFGMVMIDKDGTFRYINPKFRELFGYDLTDVPDGKTWFRKAYPDPTYRHHVIGTWIKDLKSIKPGEKRSEVFTVKCKDGTEKIIHFIPVPLETGEYLTACEDITDRKQAEEALRRSKEESQELAKENAVMAEIGRIISSSLNITEVYEPFGKEVRKIIPFDRILINLVNPEDNTFTTAFVMGVDVDGRPPGAVIRWSGSATREVFNSQSSLLIQTMDIDELVGRFPALLPHFQAGLRSFTAVPLFSKGNVIGVLQLQSTKPNAYTERDLRLIERIGNQIAGAIANAQLFMEHMRLEEEKAALQEQFRQSQKMEAVGRLAGGIAHDFNNLLTIIKGYSQLSLLDLKESDPLWGNIQEIQKATQRATDLTRQLLAFSRRQILELKVLDLNTLLRELDKMLRRIIGEDIKLTTLLAEDLGRVKIDPGQIEQVIFNLAVNARDAMPSGGKLIIETTNVELDKEYAKAHIGVVPGHYVRLSVSDTGFGMSQEIREKAFEPFFTTKDKGKGTGLGLSTVYGIVKQSGGNIWVYSEPGHGTIFKIYLPRVEEELDTLHGQDETGSLPRGSETVLLVEDEPSVRNLAHHLLNQQGYKVLEAGDGEEALRVAQEHIGEKIHLLLTDVVMPQMGGKELAEKLKLSRPEIGVLYTSGYTDNAIVHHGMLEPGTYFLQKPFSHKTLSHKVREVLDK